MPWVRIDDHFDEHPKFAKAGPLGIALWLAGLAYCNRNQTDGFIPWAKAHSLLSWEFLATESNNDSYAKSYKIGVTSGMSGNDVTSEFVTDLLVDSELWEPCAGGYRVHDYSDYQPTKAQLETERARKQAAGQAGGQARAQARAKALATAPAQAGAKAGAQAKPKPVPGPGPYEASNEASHVADSAKAQTDTRIDEVYAHFKTHIQPRSRICPRPQIAARLKRFSADELRLGVDHFAADWWEMEHNGSRSAEWFFQKDSRSENYLLMTPRAQPTAPVVRNGRPPEPERRIVDHTGVAP